jgi:hypothetical protein
MRQMQQQQQQMQQFGQMLQQSDEAERRQQQEAAMYPGQTRGWPSASIFSQCNLPNLRQPAGTTVSYDYNSGNRVLRIYILNGTQNTINEMARAIEAAGKFTYKENSSRTGNQPYFVLPMPSGVRGADHYQVTFGIIEGGVELFARAVSG